MSNAREIREIEPRSLDWLTVEDDRGRVWRYRRVGPLDLAEPAHVEGHFSHGKAVRAALVRDNDGHPLLHADGPGLPPRMAVEVFRDPTDLVEANLGLPGKVEYVLVA